jgi:hypothetical protein
MDEPIILILFFSGFLLVAALVSIFQVRARKKREQDLAEYADRRGFVMYPAEERGFGSFLPGYSFFGNGDHVGGGQAAGRLGEMFFGFSPFGSGHSRAISNVITGELPWGTFYTFDYRYVTGAGKSRHEHRYGIVAFRVPLNFVKLNMRPEGFMDALGGVFGVKDIQLESDEFNQEFHVSSGNDRFAFDILHPNMMEYLLSIDRLNWQLMGPYIVLICSGCWPIGRLDSLIATGERFLQLIPDYVRQDIGFQPQWTSSFD